MKLIHHGRGRIMLGLGGSFFAAGRWISFGPGGLGRGAADP